LQQIFSHRDLVSLSNLDSSPPAAGPHGTTVLHEIIEIEKAALPLENWLKYLAGEIRTFEVNACQFINIGFASPNRNHLVGRPPDHPFQPAR
jgi:hypothetical protein